MAVEQSSGEGEENYLLRISRRSFLYVKILLFFFFIHVYDVNDLLQIVSGSPKSSLLSFPLYVDDLPFRLQPKYVQAARDGFHAFVL